jgi:hypothetical protein
MDGIVVVIGSNAIELSMGPFDWSLLDPSTSKSSTPTPPPSRRNPPGPRRADPDVAKARCEALRTATPQKRLLRNQRTILPSFHFCFLL